MFESTYHGLMKWYSNEIEKFGWMVIFAQNEQNAEYKVKKLELYIESLNELKSTIEEKITSIEEKDRKEDLLIIHRRLTKFIPFAGKNLKISELIGGAKKKSSKKSKK